MDLPLHEDDLASEGLLEPSRLFAANDAPRLAVMCFFQEVVSAHGQHRHALMNHVYGRRPMFVTEHQGQQVAFFYPGLGAPAAAMAMEEAIAMGCRDFVAIGGAGALVPELEMGTAVVVNAALRDEGTSAHYLAASRSTAPDSAVTEAIAAALESAHVPFVRGMTWTTDAIYRETRERVRRRVQEGCISVEMEAAALFAVARYRGVRVGQLLYAGDTLAGEEWDHRGWLGAKSLRERLFQLALDAAVRIPRP